MKAITCVICGSQKFKKINEKIVCQNCGAEYSYEEAKKLIIEVDETRSNDGLSKIDNYFLSARRARETNNANDALKYYGLIRDELPNNWEAYFFQYITRRVPVRRKIPTMQQKI